MRSAPYVFTRGRTSTSAGRAKQGSDDLEIDGYIGVEKSYDTLAVVPLPIGYIVAATRAGTYDPEQPIKRERFKASFPLSEK